MRPTFPIVSMALVSLATLTAFFPFSAEDAFIVARYAENLVDQGELVFNPGERISALTSPLHVGLEAALYALFGKTLVPNKLLSIGLLLASTALVWVGLRNAPEARVLATALLLLGPNVLLWTVGGLETPLLMLLATGIAVIASSPRPPSEARLTGVWVLSGLAFVARYDSVCFTAPLLAWARWPLPTGSRVRSVALGLAAPLLWLASSAVYFQDILPTSAYVKAPSLHADRIAVNAAYVAEQLMLSGLLPLAAWTIASFVSGGSTPRLVASVRRRGALWCGLFGALAYALTTATAHMMFGLRVLVPFYPAALIAAMGPWSDRSRVEGERVARSRLLPAGLALFLALQNLYVWEFSVDGLSRRGEYKRVGLRDYAHSFLPVLAANAADIRSHWRSTGATRSPRVLTFAAGRLPYELKEAYIYERLVSFRRRCRYDLRTSADYLHVLSPRHGRVADQLPAAAGGFEVISAHRILFDGQPEDFLVFYNPQPEPNRLPATLDGECRPSPPLPGA